MTTEKHNELLDETLFMKQLSSGIKCYIIPKKGYVEKQAMIAVRYGSADNRFALNGTVHETPEGVAHFLEHKLFESENGSVFDRFIRQGANVNAFTNYTQTAYYFNCIDHFEENLSLLLDFTQAPYLTEENVQKEKGIIGEEIKMYADTPNWRVYKNLHACFYDKSPLRDDIVGDLNSIETITRDTLQFCFETFYTPSNMALICVGDLEPEKICALAEERVCAADAGQIKRLYGEDAAGARLRETEQNMPISMSIFELGFKETDFETPLRDRIITGKLLTDIIAGESSALFENMYAEGLVDASFAMDYLSGSFYGESIFSGASRQPRAVRERVLAEIQRLRCEGIEERRFAAIQKKHIGRLIRGCNQIDQLSFSLVDLIGKDLDLFDLAESLQRQTPASALERLHRCFTEDNAALSIIAPNA